MKSQGKERWAAIGRVDGRGHSDWGVGVWAEGLERTKREARVVGERCSLGGLRETSRCAGGRNWAWFGFGLSNCLTEVQPGPSKVSR